MQILAEKAVEILLPYLLSAILTNVVLWATKSGPWLPIYASSALCNIVATTCSKKVAKIYSRRIN